MYSNFTEDFLKEAASCNEACLLFAPYVKEAFLRKLFSEIRNEVRLVLLTRANPYDFVMGALVEGVALFAIVVCFLALFQ